MVVKHSFPHFFPCAVIKSVAVAALHVSATVTVKTSLMILAVLTAAKRTFVQTFLWRKCVNFGFG